MQDVVTVIALILALLSFGAFVVFAWRLRAPSPSIDVGGLGAQAEQQSLKESIEAIAKLVESISKLADSLAKAGPAIASLVASIVFFSFAFAGAFR